MTLFHVYQEESQYLQWGTLGIISLNRNAEKIFQNRKLKRIKKLQIQSEL